MNPKREFPILVKLFGDQEAGWKFLKEKGIKFNYWSDMRHRGVIGGQPKQLLIYEILRRLMFEKEVWKSRPIGKKD
jgi:hypothetical protein